MHALGTYLTRQMEARDWNQSELARRAGISRQSVAKLLADQDRMGGALDRHTFEGLATALEVPVETIVVEMAAAMHLPLPQHDNDSDARMLLANLEHALLDDGLGPDELLEYLSKVLALADAIVGRVRAKKEPAPATRKGSVSSSNSGRGSAR